jgi:hypothetical protein
MLEFYFDFMDVFVDRSDFQYCSMDMDSAYMALSATSLEEVIKPEMQQRFRMEKKNWFPRDDTPTKQPICMGRSSRMVFLLISTSKVLALSWLHLRKEGSTR